MVINPQRIYLGVSHEPEIQLCFILNDHLVITSVELSTFITNYLWFNWASQVALVVKNVPANARDIRDAGSIPGSGRSPGGEHGNHSSVLAWGIPRTEEPGGLQSMRLQNRTWLKQLSTQHIPGFVSKFFFCPSDLFEFWLPRIWLFGLECYCSTLKSTESVNMLGSIASFPIKQLLNTTL